MYRVASRQASILKNDLFGALDDGAIYDQDPIYYAEKGVEGRLDCIPAIDRHIAMQDLLQNFGIGHKGLAIPDQFFEQTLRVGFVRMMPADKIHGNVGID